MKMPTLLLPLVLSLAAAVSATGNAPPSMDLPDLHEATALSLEEVLAMPTNRPTDERVTAHACSSTCVPDAAGHFNPVPQGLAADFILRVRAGETVPP